MRNLFIISSFLVLTGIVALALLVWPPVWFLLILVLPVVILGFEDMWQTQHAIRRNFPILGWGRYFAELLRPKLYQYFIESDIDGRPVGRDFRKVVYARSKQEIDTTPFGTKLDVYAEGYEWINHSIGAKDPDELIAHPKVRIGGPDCKQPYDCSLFNVSAMSFGSLSNAAVRALNSGAKKGNFAHNTGEGGISHYHLEPGGDLIYQVGTGYFGCRSEAGGFDPLAFEKMAAYPQVKMIELKLSQGAKPGHGGILPATKNTPEIAKIRGIKAGVDVNSPPFHRAFNTPEGLLKLIKQMQDLSGGKPVGFKLCVGRRSEFLAICKAMLSTGIKPDFISVDGGEGGTGAAPLEFSNSVGMPHKEGLAFVVDALRGFDLKKDVKVIAAGKIFTAFHMFRTLALGADSCYSARAMMMALGCIQALECNRNTCPTGVATQDRELVKGLVVSDKAERVYHYHTDTIKAFVELLAATGLETSDRLMRRHVFRRISNKEILRYDQLYPNVEIGCLLDPEKVPEHMCEHMDEATMSTFEPKYEMV